jgi:vitamin B12 transporter
LPSYTELLFVFFGNPNQKPERATSGDVGLEWFPIKNLGLTANGYYQRFHGLITSAYGVLQAPITVNLPDANIAGLELDVHNTPGIMA